MRPSLRQFSGKLWACVEFRGPLVSKVAGAVAWVFHPGSLPAFFVRVGPGRGKDAYAGMRRPVAF